MKKKILTIFMGLILLANPASALAAAGSVANESASLVSQFSLENGQDERAEKLEKFLESFSSPLACYAKNFIEEADRYQIDWKLVPAISGVESTFGKKIPYQSYNAYGWANGDYRFSSWENSISHVTKVLKEKYYDRGLTTPFKIAPVYAPPSSTWGQKVAYFMAQIENFEVNSPGLLELSL